MKKMLGTIITTIKYVDIFFQGGIPTIVHDAGNSHALSTSDADLKQRMKDKIRFRRESQGIGEINVEDLFEEPRQYDVCACYAYFIIALYLSLSYFFNESIKVNIYF